MRRVVAVVMISLAGVTTLGCGSSVGTTKPKDTTPSTTTTTTGALTPTTAPPTTAPPATAVVGRASCTSGQLSVTVGPSQGAAGTEIVPLVFTNTGTTLCTLQGYPGVSAVVASGVQLGRPAHRVSVASTPLDALEPGQTTQAIFTYSDPLNQCTDPTTALGLRVYPPNQTAALFVPTTGVGQCPGAGSSFGIYPIGSPLGA